MTTENPKTPKKNKKDRSKKRKFENVEEKVVEDPVIKKKKKFKKAKKENVDEAPQEKIEHEDVEQTTEENNEEKTEENEAKLKKGPSKRQIKRERALQKAEIERECSKQDNAQKALNYVSTWKHAKEQWKFNKVKQIWLFDNLLNEKYVPEEHYSTILEYFESSKGKVKQTLINKAMKVIKKVEESIEEDEDFEETTEYKRARQLLQALSNET